MDTSPKNISTSNKSSSSSTNGEHSSAQTTYERGSIVWCKHKNYPYWPGIISNKIDKSTGTFYNVFLFGTFSYELAIEPKWLEPYESAAEFQKRIIELKASEIPVTNKSSQYDMKIREKYLELFEEAIKQASEVINYSTVSERLKRAEDITKRTICDFLTVQLDDDNKKENKKDNDETILNVVENNNSIQLLSSIQNDQQVIKTMIDQNEKKRKLEDKSLSNGKIRRFTTINEVKQSSDNHPSSMLFRHSPDERIVIYQNCIRDCLTLAEEKFILDAIAELDSTCTFFEAKKRAEQMRSTIICLNNQNCISIVNEIWFYVFLIRYMDELFLNHLHWLDDLEQANTNDNSSLSKQQEKLIRFMKIYLD
ncbi:unnamed protein product [Rotaria sp. Silwood2]|nr:unnamed protein product [Rotaria sp. Silwood2]CAF4538496.1 unnamed protein product [Rotaria sp. Silwood2]